MPRVTFIPLHFYFLFTMWSVNLAFVLRLLVCPCPRRWRLNMMRSRRRKLIDTWSFSSKTKRPSPSRKLVREWPSSRSYQFDQWTPTARESFSALTPYTNPFNEDKKQADKSSCFPFVSFIPLLWILTLAWSQLTRFPKRVLSGFFFFFFVAVLLQINCNKEFWVVCSLLTFNLLFSSTLLWNVLPIGGVLNSRVDFGHFANHLRVIDLLYLRSMRVA
jgi:hypothetical protein